MSVDESRQRRQQLIEQLRASGALRDEAVAGAFRAVPREIFLPGLPLDQVYQDQAIVTKEENGVGVSSSSQPAIMAIMLEQLDVRPGMQVLEIGAGTGWLPPGRRSRPANSSSGSAERPGITIRSFASGA